MTDQIIAAVAEAVRQLQEHVKGQEWFGNIRLLTYPSISLVVMTTRDLTDEEKSLVPEDVNHIPVGVETR